MDDGELTSCFVERSLDRCVRREGSRTGCEAFLEKPATSEVIAAVVARVIASGERDR